jgi:hypothetical protein
MIKSFISWLSHLLDISHRQKTLNVSDLYDLLPEYESIKLTDKLEANWLDELKGHPDKPRLFRATIRTMGWKSVLNGLFLIPFVSRHDVFYLLPNIQYIYNSDISFDCSTFIAHISYGVF